MKEFFQLRKSGYNRFVTKTKLKYNNMSQNISLCDGEIAVLMGDATVIMNVNTALEIMSIGGCIFNKQEQEQKIPDSLKPWIQTISLLIAKSNTEKTVTQDPSLNNTDDAKSSGCSTKKEKTVPVVAFEFDKERAYKWNDLRAGVGKYIKRFDSMTEADFFYGVNPGTTSSVVNTWLPYMNYTGIMNPMIGDMKNYMFSSKYKGKSLRWSLYPYCNQYRSSDKVPGVKVKLKGVVLFRADAIPHFIKMRYPDIPFNL